MWRKWFQTKQETHQLVGPSETLCFSIWDSQQMDQLKPQVELTTFTQHQPEGVSIFILRGEMLLSEIYGIFMSQFLISLASSAQWFTWPNHKFIIISLNSWHGWKTYKLTSPLKNIDDLQSSNSLVIRLNTGRGHNFGIITSIDFQYAADQKWLATSFPVWL